LADEPLPPERRLALDEQVEIVRDRRRRVVASVLYGAEARPGTAPPGPWGPLIAGLTLAVFAVLAVGLATLIRASLPASHPAPAHPSPTVSSR